ncbi:MAG: 2-hydroxyacid dehydrogenase [Burkholderiales bacterium]|nr:2-hydroxyacid dehydrogenase [Burkholderiales bacterium]MCZ2136324.1 2-hydroxyacid dehydrogenase [Burkholderiales bacterium]
MSQPEIVAVAPLAPFFAERLRQHFIVHDLHGAGDAEAKAALAARIAPRTRGMVAFGGSKLKPEQIRAFPHLEIISVLGVGYDGVPIDCCAEARIKVTHTPDVLNDEVADTAVALTLMVCRRFVAAQRFVEAGQWGPAQFPLTRSIWGKTAGIVGLGRIGREIAARLVAHRMQVIYHGRHRQPDVPYRYYDDLHAMARDSDVLIVVTPGGAATRHLIDATVLGELGPEGSLINVARGSVVDEEALVRAIETNAIAGAGLDVFAAEPTVPAALMNRPNVVLLPHVASATVETRQAMAALAADNLVLHFSGQPVKTLVPELRGVVAP